MPSCRCLALVVAAHATLHPFPGAAQGLVPPISRQTAIVSGLIFVGALWGDQEFREEAQEFRSPTTNGFARIGNAFGSGRVMLPALSAAYLAGEIAGNRAVKATVLRAALSVALSTAITTGLKYTIGRLRPSEGGSTELRPFSGANSFPSGHSTAAFAFATALADQTHDPWSDYLLYSAATLTAMARVNDNRHWTSDVLAGALIGHLSARYVGRRTGPIQVSPAGMALRLQF